MFHSELYSSSNGTSGATTFAQVNGLTTDNILPTQNQGYTVLQQLAYLAHVIGIGAHQCSVRPQANSMLPYPYITQAPSNRGTAAESPVRMLDLTLIPFPLRPTEEFDVFASQNSGGAEIQYALVNFCDGPPRPAGIVFNPPALVPGTLQVGRAFTVHATGSTTLTANAFSSVALTLDQTLPPGTYALIGMRAFSAHGLFARMFPSVPPQWRPGTICTQAYDALDPWYSRAWPLPGGGVVAPMGIWLTFPQNVLPQVEIYSTAADTAEEFWLDLVYYSTSVMPTI